MGGAPAIASSAGAFVAGKVAQAATAKHPVTKTDPHPPSFWYDSAWRLEPPPLGEGSEVPSSKSNGESRTGGNDGKGTGKGGSSVIEEVKDSGKNEDEHVDDKVDDIPLGYSPASPVPSSKPAPSVAPANKFDKIYHQNLGSKSK